MTFILCPLKKPISEFREIHRKDSYILLEIIILDRLMWGIIFVDSRFHTDI